MLRLRGAGRQIGRHKLSIWVFLGRTRARLSLKELGQFAGGMHHNAVGIASRRFAERLENDHALLSRVSLVQKALELR
jgi:chromosomal replication initiation ATPase DnaA